uniref:PAR14-like first RRM domain-containing protein n=1 Tax=Xiphophorus couchianus TaxID=32473 RepID=A0A3B5LG48_9TELE
YRGQTGPEYTFHVLVELEETNTPRLKNKLVKYFQSKKSNGGDCEVDYESGSSTALLRFQEGESQTMTVRLPSDGKQKEVRAKKWKLVNNLTHRQVPEHPVVKVFEQLFV